MEVLIRDAVAGDLIALADVFRRSSLSNEGDRASLLSNPDALDFSGSSVEAGRTRVAVLANGPLLGFASLLGEGDVAELDDLFVDPDWMGHGVARALVADLVAVARRRRVRRIEVTANPHALGFYEKAGFVTDGSVETRFGPGLRMHLAVERLHDGGR